MNSSSFILHPSSLLELGRLESWLRHRGRADLTATDRGLPTPAFARLTQDARGVADLAEDLIEEGLLP